MRKITGKHVLVMLLAFFGVMLVVNAVFVYFATSTFSGLSTEDAYRKGVHYNDSLAEFRAQQTAGWSASVEVAGETVRLTIRDGDGRPVDGLEIRAHLGRPATQAMDRQLAFTGEGEGLYVAETGGLAAGQWQLNVDAFAAGDPGPAAEPPPYKVTARLWLGQ